MNVAVTPCAVFMVTLQVALVPLQAPLQPLKVEPVPGVSVRVTEVPLLKLALQLVPQLMPAGLEVTVPDPLSLTLSV